MFGEEYSTMTVRVGERQCRVGLEVSERGRPDQRVRVGVGRAVRGAKRVAHPRAEDLLRICHADSLGMTNPR
jgi:hypothetical protein